MFTKISGPDGDRPELEVDTGRLVVEIHHLHDVSLTVSVESGRVGDDWLVQFTNLKHGSCTVTTHYDSRNSNSPCMQLFHTRNSRKKFVA